MQIALVHDWLVGMRGGERLFEALCEMFPQADVFTLLHSMGACSPTIEKMKIHTSFISRLPFARKRYRHYLPLFPHAIEGFDFTGYDLVISSSHCVAKGVITPPRCVHISYVHTPMRYMWDQYPEYFANGRAGPLTCLGARVVAPFLRVWDESSAARVDHFVANSKNVACRIEKRYRRRAEVIYPPVDIERFRVLPSSELGDYYLMVTAFAPYKRIDLAIETFKKLDKKLLIVGDGQERARLERLARPPIRLLGNLKDEEVAELYSRCKALVFPGEEDAGITPLEAQASGRPVIALKRGGAVETVIGLSDRTRDRFTGVFFDVPTSRALSDAVSTLEANFDRFVPELARQNAEKFSKGCFKQNMSSLIGRVTGRLQSSESLT